MRLSYSTVMATIGRAVMRFARLRVRRSMTLEVRVTMPGFVAKLERYRFRNRALTATHL